MAKVVPGNMLIAQSGGPTVVINQSLVGAVLQARKSKAIRRIYGSLHGISRKRPSRISKPSPPLRRRLSALCG